MKFIRRRSTIGLPERKSLRATLARFAMALVLNCSVWHSAWSAPDDQEVVLLPADAEPNAVNGMDIDQWIFQTTGGNPGVARVRLQTRVKVQLDELDGVCGLTDAQKKKLQLAASGDTRRFFDDVQRVRRKFQGEKDQNAMQQIWQEIQPLQQKLATDIYGETSFFAKTLRSMLTPEQRAKYQMIVDERRRYRFRVMVATSLLSIERSVPLKHAQHMALKTLLLENIQPPQSFGQYDHYVVLYHLSRLPEEKIRPLFGDDAQWRLLQEHLRQVQGMEPFLIQNGLVSPKEQPDQPPQPAQPEQPGEKAGGGNSDEVVK